MKVIVENEIDKNNFRKSIDLASFINNENDLCHEEYINMSHISSYITNTATWADTIFPQNIRITNLMTMSNNDSLSSPFNSKPLKDYNKVYILFELFEKLLERGDVKPSEKYNLIISKIKEKIYELKSADDEAVEKFIKEALYCKNKNNNNKYICDIEMISGIKKRILNMSVNNAFYQHYQHIKEEQTSGLVSSLR
jgi:hypothetical protein